MAGLSGIARFLSGLLLFKRGQWGKQTNGEDSFEWEVEHA